MLFDVTMVIRQNTNINQYVSVLYRQLYIVYYGQILRPRLDVAEVVFTWNSYFLVKQTKTI